MEDFLYAQVADRLENLIHKGLLKTGDKLASVRALSREQGISLSTAYKAYSQLERRGLIEARTKSGYYVRFTPRAHPGVPAPQARSVLPAPGAPTPLSTAEMVDHVYNNLSGENVVRFSLAAPALELLPRARLNKTLMEAIRRYPDSCIGYDHVRGNMLLRTQIALQAFHWGGSVTEDDVVTTHGCMEAVMLALRAVTRPGDTVALETPTFFGLIRGVSSLGLKILEIPGNPDTGIDLDFLERALTETTVNACLFVPNFSNPLGACMPDAHKIRLVEFLAGKNIPLIEDDIYGDLHFDKARPRNCKSWDTTGNVLLCSSISKSLAPGYRVGWCIPGRFAEKVLALKRVHGISSTHPTHAAVGLFFANNRFDLHMRHLRKALHTQSLQYIQAIARYFPPDTRVTQPRGGYVLWVEMNPALNAFALFQSAIEEKISISPGQIFSMDERYSHCMRLSFGMPYTPPIDKALKTLGKLVQQAIQKALTLP